MQIWTSVNEADIGQVKPGLPVRFTVDAYLNETFLGEVAQIRLNATMTQNVVTYTVVVKTDNSSGKLLPYLTANVQFEVNKRSNVTMVPNSALRWKPQPQQVAPEARTAVAEGGKRKGGEKETHSQGIVWVEDGPFVRPVKVKTGLSNGTATEILEGDLKENDAVVVGVIRNGGSNEPTNPFTPQMFGGQRRPQ